MDPPPLIDFSDDVVSSATSHSYTDHQGTRIFDRYSSSLSPSSSEDGETESHPSNSTIKRLDYMMEFLERKLSSSATTTNEKKRFASSSSLPEYIGKGGYIPMFKPPVRAALHPARPPSLEVRPHPLRETQIGCFLRTIVCTGEQLWAGGENGLRVWNLKELYDESESDSVSVSKSRDEDGTAPFKESVKGVSSVMCMVGDEASGVVWSGHRDGRIMCWKMNARLLDSDDGFGEVLSWQAHRGPVLSLCISSYG